MHPFIPYTVYGSSVLKDLDSVITERSIKCQSYKVEKILAFIVSSNVLSEDYNRHIRQRFYVNLPAS